ncbi:MAG: transglutaminase family protein [Luteolibacter sp.]
MILDASCQLSYQTTEDVAVIFMLRPRSGWAQWVLREEFHISPEAPMVEFSDVYGNLCQRTIMPAGEFFVSVRYRVKVADFIDVTPDAPLTPVEELPTDVIQFLLPSRYCQSDLMTEMANSITANVPPSYQQVQEIHNWVHREISYVSESSNASTSAVDTLESRCGVCRDFAHLGIALCRAMSIPARMVVGFLHELEPMDLHAWFEAFIGGRWYTFDATQADTKGNRIVIAYGRDAADVALATIFGDFAMNGMFVSVSPADVHADG